MEARSNACSSEVSNATVSFALASMMSTGSVAGAYRLPSPSSLAEKLFISSAVSCEKYTSVRE